VFLAFLQLKIVVNAWMVAVIMLREFIVTGLRLYVLKSGEVLEAKRWGKHKTVSQVAGIVVIFIALLLFMKFPQQPIVIFLYAKVTLAMMWYVVFITLFSGVYYFWINRRLIKTF
ncbi:MAG: CDP-diacylglycerol--glycerol-3-phosphate 3-phosphatidyltransferase, partial [Candidatus Omnitrophica bacterium]|nr:CDP-diacylglycerol--glycerol-3-phosphate 3-phosphatidyltransferase [Candidatus Omnitrophota bacterium]